MNFHFALPSLFKPHTKSRKPVVVIGSLDNINRCADGWDVTTPFGRCWYNGKFSYEEVAEFERQFCARWKGSL